MVAVRLVECAECGRELANIVCKECGAAVCEGCIPEHHTRVHDHQIMLKLVRVAVRSGQYTHTNITSLHPLFERVV